jgi:hypothetical protein
MEMVGGQRGDICRGFLVTGKELKVFDELLKLQEKLE